MKSNIVIFAGFFATFCAWADAPNLLDTQLMQLTQKRDQLKAELEACEKNTRGFKIAGISTLAATGVGVWGNIKLAQEIKKVKQSGTGGGYGGGVGGVSEDLCAKDDICKWERECEAMSEEEWQNWVDESRMLNPEGVAASEADPACGPLCCAAHTTACRPGC